MPTFYDPATIKQKSASIRPIRGAYRHADKLNIRVSGPLPIRKTDRK